MNFKNTFLLIFLIFFLSACIPKQNDVKSVFQSNAANIIKYDYKRLQKLLLSFKSKLNKRNPKAYDKNLEKKITTLIKNSEKSLYLKYENTTLKEYKDYLNLAFSKENIPSRNDYLILGLYYSIYDAYDIQDGHRFTALQYSKEKLHKLHKNLQVLRWKIKVDRDTNNEYLFLTWQNNWQVELERKINNNHQITYLDIENLKYIKEKKESLLDHSNFTFEIILTQMIDNVENSLVALGEEPTNLTIGAVMFLFL